MGGPVRLSEDLCPAIWGLPALDRFPDAQLRKPTKTLPRIGRGNLKPAMESDSPDWKRSMAGARREYGSRSQALIYDSSAVFPPPRRGRDIEAVEFAAPSAPFLSGSYADQLSAICSPIRGRLALSPMNRPFRGRTPPAAHGLRGRSLYCSSLASPRRRARDRSRQPARTRATHPQQER